MSSQKTSNNDSCRDLNGRRLSTVKEAKKLAEYLEGEPARKRAAAEAQKAKLEELERRLGIDGAADPSTAEPDVLAGKKHRFDDTEYLEQSREIVDNVKSAVSAGLLKKKKKAKLSHGPPEPNSVEASAPDAIAVAAESITQVASNKTVESIVTAPAAVLKV